MKVLSFIFFLLLRGALAQAGPIEFRADYYSRDLSRNVTIGKGNAWIKSGGREIWANEIELDSVKKLATATGEVRIQDGEHRISAAHGVVYLDSDHAVLEQAVISSDQMILQGNTIEKVGKDQYRVLEGSYTNCNLSQVKAENFSSCRPDWRLYGKRIEVTIGGYAHIYDAIVYVKQLPIMYSPYLVVPAKTSRETGILTPGIYSISGLGTGVTVPFFWALDSWHDPLPSNVGADVWLVLMIGEDHLDLLAQDGPAEILDSHPCGVDRALAADVGIKPGLIVQHPNPDDVAG